MRLGTQAFGQLVEEAVQSLPDWVQSHLDNISIVVDAWPSRHQLQTSGTPAGHTLLGLYEGVPLLRRGHGYNLVAPDRITLFQGPLEARAPDTSALKRLIARVVVHEIAHHFGFDEGRLTKLGI